VLDAPYHVHDLKPALRQRVLCLDRKCRCIDVSGDDPFILQLLQALREDLGGDTVKSIAELGKPAGVSLTFTFILVFQQGFF